MAERPVFEQHVFEEHLEEMDVPEDLRATVLIRKNWILIRSLTLRAWKAGMAVALERAKDSCNDYGEACKGRSDDAERIGEKAMAFGLMGEMVGALECATRVGLLKDRLVNEDLLTREGG